MNLFCPMGLRCCWCGFSNGLLPALKRPNIPTSIKSPLLSIGVHTLRCSRIARKGIFIVNSPEALNHLAGEVPDVRLLASVI